MTASHGQQCFTAGSSRMHLVFLIVLATILPLCTPAAVPQIKTAGPGFFRLMLGDFEITALHDGTVPFPTDENMPIVPKSEILHDLEREDIPFPTTVSINAFLINTKEHLVLIDTGVGILFGNCCGLILNNLRAAGYQPGQIDLVLLTHLHGDHEAGLAPYGEMVFPNAVVRTSQAEADYWLDLAKRMNVTDYWKQYFDWAGAAVKPYKVANQFKPFNETDGELVPGIRPFTHLGHTPGHTPYFIESRGQTLVAWGDTMHFQSVQMPNPSVTVIFDYKADEARKARLDLINLVVEKKYLVAGAHIDFPGIGHVRRGYRQGFEWVPARYDSDPASNKTADFSI